MNELPEGAQCLLSDARGIYIPQNFAEIFAWRAVHGVEEKDLVLLLEGPESEHYWETWDHVLQNAVLRDAEGNEYTLHQDGDLWAIPKDAVWPGEEE